MTAEATKTTRIRATQTQIGNKSLQPTDKPPPHTRLSDVPNLLRRQTETGHIYKYKGAVFARSRQACGFPSGAKCRSRKVGRRPRRPARPRNKRDNGPGETAAPDKNAEQAKPRRPPPLRRATAGHRTRGSEARAPPNPAPEAAETPFSVQKSGRGFGFSKFFSIFVPRQSFHRVMLHSFAYFFYSFFFYAKRKCGTPCIG